MRKVASGVLMMAVLIAACSKQTESARDTPSPQSAPQAVATQPAAADVPAGGYQLDLSHASLVFRINHMGFSNYTARFRRFDAQLQFDPLRMAESRVTATVDVRSLETDYPEPQKLDFNAQLRGPDWFNAEQYPEMMYRSGAVVMTGPGRLRVAGELTMRGVTRPVTMDVTFNGGYPGMQLDPNARIGFSARTVVKRSEFGMTAGIPPPGSRMGVSDDVEVLIETEFSGPAWIPPAPPASSAPPAASVPPAAKD